MVSSTRSTTRRRGSTGTVMGDRAEWPAVHPRDEGDDGTNGWSRPNLLACPMCGATVAREHQDQHQLWHGTYAEYVGHEL